MVEIYSQRYFNWSNFIIDNKLIVNKRNLTVLNGLDYFNNLTEIDLGDNRIHSLIHLEYLINLNRLNLKTNRIRNVFYLRHLINLVELNLCYKFFVKF